MPSDPRQRFIELLVDLTPVQRHAATAADPGADAVDGTGIVTVTLAGNGRVCAVDVDDGWRRLLSLQQLGAAVREAAQQAAAQRLTRWGAVYAEPPAGHRPLTPSEDDDLAGRLQEAASRPMSGDDVRTAVLELLAIADDLERGLDEVSARLPQTLAARHTGNSADQRVAVTVTGSGAIAEVGYDTGWLRTATSSTISRLLDEATNVYLRLKATLLEVADQYEDSDQAAAAKLKGVWDVRD